MSYTAMNDKTLVKNENALKAAGFFLDHARLIWVSRDRRMVFTHDVIRDHPLEWLEARLLEHVPDEEFRFHSNHALSLESCMEILNRGELSHLTPVNRHWI